MYGDCVFDAWKDYAHYLDERIGLLDRIKFWRIRLDLSGGQCWPGSLTPVAIIPDLITLMNKGHALSIKRIETEVYDISDFSPDGSIGVYRDNDMLSTPIYMMEGMFYSLDSRHAYFARKRDVKDWVCLAIQLRRRFRWHHVGEQKSCLGRP